MSTCYYFDNTIKFENNHFDSILVVEKSHQNILIYNILYKTLIGAKPLRIRWIKIDGFITISDRKRYLVLLFSCKMWYHLQ